MLKYVKSECVVNFMCHFDWAVVPRYFGEILIGMLLE